MHALDKLYLRLAKTVIEGTFEGSHFRKKPDVDLFPTKKNCPHCGGRRRKAWDFASAEKLLDDMVGLARQIKRRKLCRSCLEQLSEIAEIRRDVLGGWDKEDSPRSSSEEGKPKVSVSRSELRKLTPGLEELMQVITHQCSIYGHMWSDRYNRYTRAFDVEIANGGKRIRLRLRDLSALGEEDKRRLLCEKELLNKDNCGRCREIYEEWELSPDGRIFLTYCEEEYDDEEGIMTGHRRRRREVIWNSQRKALRFPPGLLDKTLDPVVDVAFKPIEGVLGMIGKAIKAATWFVYCRCSSPDPYLAYHDEGTPVYKCRRCENFVDR